MLNGVSKKMCEELIMFIFIVIVYFIRYVPVALEFDEIWRKYLITYENLLDSKQQQKLILLNSCHPICYFIVNP